MAKEIVLTKQNATEQIIYSQKVVKDGCTAVVAEVVTIGRILCSMKKTMEHGKFGKWIKEELPFEQTAANNYMRLYKRQKEFEGKDIGTVSGAIKLLCEPNEPEEQEEPNEPKTERKASTPTTTRKRTKSSSKSGQAKDTGPKKEPTKPKDTKKKLMTSAGQEVPEHLEPIFGRVNEMRADIKAINDILKRYKKMEVEGDELYQYVSVNPLEVEAKNVTRNIRQSMPYAVCGYCKGDDSQDCKPCNGTGWVSQLVWNAHPEEFKQ